MLCFHSKVFECYRENKLFSIVNFTKKVSISIYITRTPDITEKERQVYMHLLYNYGIIVVFCVLWRTRKIKIDSARIWIVSRVGMSAHAH